MSLLDKLLSKKGIKSIDDLSPEERSVFDGYKRTLTAKTITVKDLEEFCRSQVKLIEGKFGGPPSPHDVYLKACLHVYLTLLAAIEAPKVEKENLERYLIALIAEQ